MSPEQIRGDKIDGRSDLFSLAVILYEALCGERPFDGETVPAIVHSVVHETPIPISRRLPRAPDGLDVFFDRALAKQPGDRFADGHAFGRALEAAIRNDWSGPSLVPTTAGFDREPEAEGWRRRGALACVAVVVIAVLWMWIGRGEGAYLQLDAKSSVDEGELTVLVDGDEVYRRDLDAPKKPKSLLKKVLDHNQETFEAYIKVRPGKHEVTANVLRDGESRPSQDTVVLELAAGETRRVKLVAGRSIGAPVSLKVP
jgi:hypothetical protein